VLRFTKIAEIQHFLRDTGTGQTIGFVPTMGALHAGHMSLIAMSRADCDLTVCSIFVNPKQFNDKNDLNRYPRTPEADAKMLEKAGCDILFTPSEGEIYPDSSETTFYFHGVDSILEGASRPGHFSGVALVVARLFEIVRPDKAYFGSKDYQQVVIVRMLVKQLSIPVDIIAAPIIREKDGLAMSSRNALLSRDERDAAALIPAVIQKARERARTSGIAAARKLVEQAFKGHPILRLDYYEVRDAETLAPLSSLDGKPAVSLLAVYCGKIRLIDNLSL
jgi:pantoate--beta-alanine ligase